VVKVLAHLGLPTEAPEAAPARAAAARVARRGMAGRPAWPEPPRSDAVRSVGCRGGLRASSPRTSRPLRCAALHASAGIVSDAGDFDATSSAARCASAARPSGARATPPRHPAQPCSARRLRFSRTAGRENVADQRAQTRHHERVARGRSTAVAADEEVVGEAGGGAAQYGEAFHPHSMDTSPARDNGRSRCGAPSRPLSRTHVCVPCAADLFLAPLGGLARSVSDRPGGALPHVLSRDCCHIRDACCCLRIRGRAARRRRRRRRL
jgi:hypothetical protein